MNKDLHFISYIIHPFTQFISIFQDQFSVLQGNLAVKSKTMVKYR